MRNYLRTIEKSLAAFSGRFRTPCSTLLRQSLTVSLGFIVISCSSAPTQQTYLKKTDFSGVSKVAIMSSANAPDVTYSISTGPGTASSLATILVPLAPLLLFPAALAVTGIEAAAKASADKSRSGEMADQIDPRIIEDKIGQTFMKSLAAGGPFQTSEYVTNKSQDEGNLADSGYDALVKLKLNKIAIERVAGDNVGLRVQVNGQMKLLRSGRIIWDREEVVSSPESGAHSLDYYKSKGNLVKALDTVLDKAMQRLAYDFMYLK